MIPLIRKLQGCLLLLPLLPLLACAIPLHAQAGGAPRQVPKPGKTVLTVIYEEKGDNGNGPWQVQCKTKYSLSHWNEWLRDKQRRLPLDLEPGAISRLPFGAKVCFYPSEAVESGSGQKISATRVLSADGVYSLTETDGNGTHTKVTTDSDFRREHNIPANDHFIQNARYYQLGDLAELTRTADGAILFAPSDRELSGGGAWSVVNEVEQQVWPAVAKFTLTNQELLNWRQISKVNVRSAQDGDNQLQIRISVMMTLEEDEIEVDVEPEAAFEKWLPKGNMETPEKRGNNLSVRASVHAKGDPGKPRKAKLVFTLKKVSMEKGVCVNWPRKGAKSDYGLKFLQEENLDMEVPGPDEAKTKEYLEEASFVVSAFDYGAWGTLNITAKDEQGRDLKVRVRGQDKSELSIPLDENHNHISDSWELANVGNLRGQQNDDDETQPDGKSGCSGDGLSLFEEYRGFRVQGNHIQADPKKKDLFICDNTAGKVATAGMNLFESTTKLKVWRMTYEEIGNDHLVNPNGSSAHIVDQHGVLIVDGGSDPEAVASTKDGRFGPPVLTEKVQLPTGRIYAAGDGSGDVAHELCHAVGAGHHGKDENMVPREWFWKLESEGVWQLYEQTIKTTSVQTALNKSTTKWVPDGDVKPIQVFHEPPSESSPMRPFTRADGPPAGSATVGVERWRLYVGKKDSPHSGDQECLMRYPDKQAYESEKEPGRVRYLPDNSQRKDRNRLCEDTMGTGVNAPKHYPQSRYGPATVGNCKGQIVVNDKYAN